MLNRKEITCSMPIPKGYRFNRIDNILFEGDYILETVTNIKLQTDDFISVYYWIILEKDTTP